MVARKASETTRKIVRTNRHCVWITHGARSRRSGTWPANQAPRPAKGRPLP
jgi:hypothetical protein